MENELKVPVQNVENTRGHLDTMGIIVTWSPNGEAGLTDIVDAFASIGLATLAPKPRDFKKALMAALTHKFSKKNRRVAPAGKGYEVLIETPMADEVRVQTTHLLSAWISTDGENQFVETDTDGFDLDGAHHTAEDLAQWVMEAKQRVDGTAIGEALSAIGASLGGIPIRDAGGGYWIPSGSIGRWNALVEALNDAGRPVRMCVWDTANTPRSIESTISSIESLVQKKCDSIMDEVNRGKLGVRALDTKTDEAIELVNQLAEYEKTLGQGLETLRAKVTEVQTATVRAGMAAQAAKTQKMQDRRMAAMSGGIDDTDDDEVEVFPNEMQA
jgi:hypothetical protein